MPSEETKLTVKLLDQLGNKLVEQGLLTQEQLDEAQKREKGTKEHLGELLLKLNFISPETLNEFIARQLEIPHVDLKNYSIDSEVLSLIDEKIARRYKIIPLFKIENVVTVAMVDPLDIFAIDNIKSLTNLEIEPVLASDEGISQAINQFYGAEDYLGQAVEELEKEDEVSLRLKEEPEEVSFGEVSDQRPMIKMVNSIINQAVKEDASDIHIEPEKDRLRIRLRVDGYLYDVSTLSKKYHAPIISRIKVLAKLDIGQKRKPQDGKIHLTVGDKRIDLRISTYPVIYGEKMAIRVLDLGKAKVKLKDIGFSENTQERYNRIIKEPNGIILVTGPTGSGKTTTLYASLNSINTEGINITTIEDPIEYQLENINQGNVDQKAGVTFSVALRTILRQDPDVIMVGEIRDQETAELAIRAALTGHLVLSTLHTNDSAGAIARLLDVGAEPFLLSSSIKGIIAQRLVRKVCHKCRKPYQPDPELLLKLGLKNEGQDITFYKAGGCSACRNSGYKGRTGIFELLITDEKIRDLIIKKEDSNKIKQAAVEGGMTTLREEALKKVLSGITTLEEASRVMNLQTSSED